MNWLTSRVSKPVLIFGAVVLLVGIVFLLGRCSANDDSAATQAVQNNRSSDALATAAAGAIETLEDRVATEDAIDQVVTETVGQIEQAATPEQVRDVVLTAVCATAEHRNDPACSTKAETRATAQGLDM